MDDDFWIDNFIFNNFYITSCIARNFLFKRDKHPRKIFIFFNKSTFQAFNSIFVMQTSSAGDTMDVVTIEIFDHFWGRVKYGYAAAEGVILFILLNVLAISQYVIFRKRINYD